MGSVVYNSTQVKHGLLNKCKKLLQGYGCSMNDDWFERLLKAIDEHPDSRRAISLRAGLADTYIHQMTTYRKQPSVERFLAICDAIEKDPIEILTGVKHDLETGQLIRRFGAMSAAQRAAFLQMLEAMQPAEPQTDPESDKQSSTQVS